MRYWDGEWVGIVKWNRQFSIGPVQSRKVVHLERRTGFSKLFQLHQTDPFGFRPKFPEILVEWIAPVLLEALTSPQACSGMALSLICINSKNNHSFSAIYQSTLELGNNMKHNDCN